MIEKPELGQRVTITDYLVRCRMDADSVLSAQEAWGGMASRTVKAAHGIKLAQERQPLHYRLLYQDLRAWLPVSLYRQFQGWHSRLHGEVASHDRAHPTLTDLALPITGLIVQQVNIQDGEIDNYGPEEGAGFNHHRTRVAYLVAYSLHRRPLTVYPGQMEATP